MIVYFSTDQNGQEVTLTEDDHRHCRKVTRKTPGDIIYVTDGQGYLHTCTISEQSPSTTVGQIVSSTKQNRRPYNLHIAVAPTKLPVRLEWMIEKCIEIGVDSIHLIDTQRSHRSRHKMDRLRRIAISAMKQSKNLYLPTLNNVSTIAEVLDRYPEANKYVAHCGDIDQHLGKHIVNDKAAHILLFIGPEGDFTTQEIKLLRDASAAEVNLGTSRLRTETAAVVGASIVATVYDAVLSRT